MLFIKQFLLFLSPYLVVGIIAAFYHFIIKNKSKLKNKLIFILCTICFITVSIVKMVCMPKINQDIAVTEQKKNEEFLNDYYFYNDSNSDLRITNKEGTSFIAFDGIYICKSDDFVNYFKINNMEVKMKKIDKDLYLVYNGNWKLYDNESPYILVRLNKKEYKRFKEVLKYHQELYEYVLKKRKKEPKLIIYRK